MTDDRPKARAAAIEGFAAHLRELRQGAGNPSFREMAGRSRAISHTTLHEAAQGTRFPSWATTVEFVKACDGNPDAERPAWESARRDVRAAGSRAGLADPDDLDDEPADPPTVPPAAPSSAGTAGEPRHASRGPWRRRTVVLSVAGVVVAAAALVSVLVATQAGGDSGGNGRSDTRLSAADCPVGPSNPPEQPPAHPGDQSTFVNDVTLHDCTHVARGTTVVKVWELRNIGSVAWRGYSLHRVDGPQRRDECQTIGDVPVHVTMPGDTVKISVSVTAPTVATFCYVRFKMKDAAGKDAFPGKRGINFQLIVE